jgi:hypothetical protein
LFHNYDHVNKDSQLVFLCKKECVM